MREYLDEMRDLLVEEDAVAPSRRLELDALIETLSCADPLESESAYVELFDRSRSTSLHLFEHVHGDSRERGPAMIDLCKTYETAGLMLAPSELPDYLPVVLEFVSTQPPREARPSSPRSAISLTRSLERCASAEAPMPASWAR